MGSVLFAKTQQKSENIQSNQTEFCSPKTLSPNAPTFQQIYRWQNVLQAETGRRSSRR